MTEVKMGYEYRQHIMGKQIKQCKEMKKLADKRLALSRLHAAGGIDTPKWAKLDTEIEKRFDKLWACYLCLDELLKEGM